MKSYFPWNRHHLKSSENLPLMVMLQCDRDLMLANHGCYSICYLEFLILTDVLSVVYENVSQPKLGDENSSVGNEIKPQVVCAGMA